jgi:hypothetical protein
MLDVYERVLAQPDQGPAEIAAALRQDREWAPAQRSPSRRFVRTGPVGQPSDVAAVESQSVS